MLLDEQISLLKGIQETVTLLLEQTLSERGGPRTVPSLPPSPSDVHIDPTNLSVSRSHVGAVVLTAKEFQIFALLDQSERHSISREVLLAKIWRAIKVSPKTLDVHIFNLRRKIAPLGLEIFFRSPNQYQLNVKAEETLRAG